MIPDSVRSEIQTTYSEFLESLGHRPRSGQKQMIASIARCLMHSQPTSKVIAIEAGTGTGKTLAYLLAAIPIARQLGKTLVVSTGTVALQEQLIHKDIPDIIDKTSLRFGYSLVKGRGRYLCQLKLDQLLSGASGDDQMGMYLDGEVTAFSETRLNLYQSLDKSLRLAEWDGDRDSWDDTIDDLSWRPLTSDRYQCLGRTCPHVNSCTFFNARNDLEDVNCLVTNHDLVLSDLALGGGAILPPPEDCIYVFDEAHHLSDKARNHFSSRFRVGNASVFMQQMKETLPQLRNGMESLTGVASVCADLGASLSAILQIVQEVRAPLAVLFTEEREDTETDEARFAYGRLPEELSRLATDLYPVMENIESQLTILSDKLEQCLSESAESEIRKDVENWFPVVGQWLARIQGYASLWQNLSEYKDERATQFARWCRYYRSADDYELFSSPIVANEILQSQLWDRCAGAVLTSATLTALGNFDRLKMRTGLPDDLESLVLYSPFNFSEHAEIRIPKDAPDPKDYLSHDQYLIDQLPVMLNKTDGNLVLFTSGRQMDEVYENLVSDWQRRILIQGTRSKQRIIDTHKKRVDAGEGSTIFGLASFAEGVDLPGAYCTHVVIAKIPFSVPTAPEEEAFSEWVESRGGKPFFDISLPDASMRLIQATGRLLRSENDQGVISILDNRLLTRGYGKQLLSALPPYKITTEL